MAESAQLKIWQFGNQAAGAEPGIIIATIDHPVVLIHADPATTPDMCIPGWRSMHPGMAIDTSRDGDRCIPGW